MWFGEVGGLSQIYIGVMQPGSRTVDKALADLCTSFEPGSRAFSRLISVFEAVFILFLDIVAAGFVLFDAGPPNLALEDDGSVVFLDWEHIRKGEAKRKDINDQVKRVVASAAARMALSPGWSSVGDAWKGMVFTSW